MWRNFLILPVAVFILLLPSVYADADVSFPNNCAVAPASYTVSVENRDGGSDNFRITSLGEFRGWTLFEKTVIMISGRGEGKFTILSFPPNNANPGTYRIPIRVYRDSDTRFQEDGEICIFIKDVREISFTTAELNQDDYLPEDELYLDLLLKNTGTESFINVELDFESTGPIKLDLSDRVFNLNRGETIEFQERIAIDSSFAPGEYSILITLIKDGNILGSEILNFNVESIEKIEVDKGGLWTPLANFRSYKFENKGNLPSEDSITLRVNRPFNALVSTKGDPEITEEKDMIVYTWNVALDPGEEEKVSYRVNYWPIILIIFLLGFGGWKIYFTLKRPSIKKILLNSRVLKDDMHEFTIALEVKNHTPHDIKSVKIRDYVPPIAKVVKDFGALVPKTNVADGTELIWTIKDLKKDDTRLIRYRIVTIIGAVDKFKLPKALINGKILDYEFRVHSNELGVGSDRNI